MAEEHTGGKSARSERWKRRERTAWQLTGRAFTCDADFLGAAILAKQLFERSFRGLLVIVMVRR